MFQLSRLAGLDHRAANLALQLPGEIERAATDRIPRVQLADADLASDDVEQLSQREQRVRVEILVCVSGLVRLRPQTGRGLPQRTSVGVVPIEATRILPACGPSPCCHDSNARSSFL
jgi:hypothetical protein